MLHGRRSCMEEINVVHVQNTITDLRMNPQNTTFGVLQKPVHRVYFCPN